MYRYLALSLYYLFARSLPSTSMPLGRYCNAIRGALCKKIFAQLGKGSVVKKGAYFGSGSELRLGINSQLGENSRVEHDTIIGDNVMMGLEVLILSTRHSTEGVDIPFIDQGYLPRAPVTVCNNVWIGARVIILPGVTVNEGAVIAAGAIVTSDVPPFTIVAGVPARVVKNRVTSPVS